MNTSANITDKIWAVLSIIATVLIIGFPVFVPSDKLGRNKFLQEQSMREFVQFSRGFVSTFSPHLEWWTIYHDPTITDSGASQFESDKSVLLLAGPYSKLRPGNYQLVLEADAVVDNTELRLRVLFGDKVYGENSFSVKDLVEDGYSFRLSEVDSAQPVIIGLYLETGSLEIHSMQLEFRR